MSCAATRARNRMDASRESATESPELVTDSLEETSFQGITERHDVQHQPGCAPEVAARIRVVLHRAVENQLAELKRPIHFHVLDGDREWEASVLFMELWYSIFMHVATR